jgi:hypothetical protein
MPLKPHPTDPDKVVYTRREYDLSAKREWVGLTDEEINEWTPEIHGVIQAIEAKLKEKNT